MDWVICDQLCLLDMGITEMDKKQVLDERAALVEMYKAGYLDGYKNFKKLKTDDDWLLLNKFYKLDFNKRFGKKITKALKEAKKEVKKNG